MATHTQIIYHIIFSTKHREKTLDKDNRKEFFQYVWGILKNKKCHLYRLNGVEDHIHIVTDLHPTIALSSLVKDIKLAVRVLLKRQVYFRISAIGRNALRARPSMSCSVAGPAWSSLRSR